MCNSLTSWQGRLFEAKVCQYMLPRGYEVEVGVVTDANVFKGDFLTRVDVLKHK